MNQQICEICIWNQNKPNMSGLGLWFDSAFLSTESVFKKKKKKTTLYPFWVGKSWLTK